MRDGEACRFSDIDLARACLIRDLKHDLGANDPGGENRTALEVQFDSPELGKRASAFSTHLTVGADPERIALDRLAAQLPLTQRYPSHLQRVLQPAHEMLVAAGLLRDAAFRQQQREWFVDYVLAQRAG